MMKELILKIYKMKIHSYNKGIMTKLIHKRLVSFAVALLLFAPISLAQPGSEEAKKDRAEKIEQLKIAFITKELELSAQEAEKFWPVYNTMNAAIKKERRARKAKSRKLRENYKTMTEAEVKKSSEAIMDSELKQIKLKKEHMNKVSEVIGYKKTVTLLLAEQKFKRELLKKLNKRKQEINRENRPNGNQPRPDQN